MAFTSPRQLPHLPLVQICVPAIHSPVLLPQLCFAPSLQLQPAPSSVIPLQSSSIPLQLSGFGLISPTHALHLFCVHVCKPERHAPRSLPQGLVSPSLHTHPALPSSMVPLQSSSMLLQVSGEGRICPLHGPHCPVVQSWLPCLQGLTFAVPVGPV